MFKILSGHLSATFNIDGQHLERFLARKEIIIKSLFEELVLHNQVIIPTQDYLTACGLTLLLGERNLISLLESNSIRFLRLRGCFGYVRGIEKDGGLVVFMDPKQKRPQDSSIEESIEAGLSAIKSQISEKEKLKKLFEKQSDPLEISEVISQIKRDSYNDLKKSVLWREEYNYSDKDLLLALPGVKKMQVKVLGPNTDIENNIVDMLLALTLFNMELYLASRFECSSLETNSPLGSLIELKASRLLNQLNQSKMINNMWKLFEINNIPDLSRICDSDCITFSNFLKIIKSQNANDFRKWFHNNKDNDECVIIKEYVSLLKSIPKIQSFPLKTLRFVITSGLGLLHPVGSVASFLDTFIIKKVLKGKSPKFFIDDLENFTKKIN